MIGYHAANRRKFDHHTSGESGETAPRGTRSPRGPGIQEQRTHFSDRSNPSIAFDSPDTMSFLRHLAPDGRNLETQRRLLLALRARLRGDVSEEAALAGCGIATTCSSPDDADLANESIEQDLALSLLTNVNGTLEQIEMALARIDDGSYGRCLDCGARMPAARLEAIPYAPCCVDCTARHERGV
jgi:DnaK suppressor protein